MADPLSAGSVDFRVDSSVFLGGRGKPVSESTTIFHGGAVYDYLKEPAEVVVFEKDQNRFVLLDSARRVRAELTTKQVKAFTEQLKQRSDAAASPYLKFLLTPQFEEQLDEDSGDLTLRSQWITYRLVLLTTASQAVAAQYREFADWYVQLNAMLDPRSRPPFARLLVNAALGRRQTIAREVQVTVASEKTLFPKQTTVHSKHQLIPEVAERDLDRITQTRQFMQIFKPVSFQQYRSGGEP